MALTKEEREKWLAVLDRTGGRKKTGREGRVIPEDYKQWKQYTERKEVVVEVPSVGVPVKCYIKTGKTDARFMSTCMAADSFSFRTGMMICIVNTWLRGFMELL